MSKDERSSIQTRPSLLKQLTDGDVESWKEFYRIYGRLVRDFSLKAGLDDAQADEVVQDTAIAVARHLPEYRYDPKVCRFKTWLLTQTSWRIKDQIRKRQRERNRSARVKGEEDTTPTAPINKIPDPAAHFDALFEEEWRKNLFAVALETVSHRFTYKQLQVFDLVAIQEWPAREVATSLKVTLANVYVIRHRIAGAVKREIRRLEAKG